MDRLGNGCRQPHQATVRLHYKAIFRGVREGLLCSFLSRSIHTRYIYYRRGHGDVFGLVHSCNYRTHGNHKTRIYQNHPNVRVFCLGTDSKVHILMSYNGGIYSL